VVEALEFDDVPACFPRLAVHFPHVPHFLRPRLHFSDPMAVEFALVLSLRYLVLLAIHFRESLAEAPPLVQKLAKNKVRISNITVHMWTYIWLVNLLLPFDFSNFSNSGMFDRVLLFKSPLASFSKLRKTWQVPERCSNIVQVNSDL
jgi:hypothetical protein